MAMKQLVIAWTTELNCEIVSDLDASAGLGRPYERRVLRRMRRRPLLRCCGLFVWFGGVVGCERFDAIDDVGRWMGLMFGCRGRRKREKGRKTAGPNDISLDTPRNALQARVTLA